MCTCDVWSLRNKEGAVELLRAGPAMTSRLCLEPGGCYFAPLCCLWVRVGIIIAPITSSENVIIPIFLPQILLSQGFCPSDEWRRAPQLRAPLATDLLPHDVLAHEWLRAPRHRAPKLRGPHWRPAPGPVHCAPGILPCAGPRRPAPWRRPTSRKFKISSETLFCFLWPARFARKF